MKQALFIITLIILFGINTSSSNTTSAKNLLLDQYRHNLLSWEIHHLPDKWVHKAFDLFPGGTTSKETRLAAIKEYFDLGQEVYETQTLLEVTAAKRSSPVRNRSLKSLHEQLENLSRDRRIIQPIVEEVLEAHITSTLDDLGIIETLGPIRWPPIDFTFDSNPLLLVTSPRSQIQRLPDVILKPGLNLSDQEELEVAVEQLDGVSALVIQIGGLATYPASVSPQSSLQRTLILASHEWLHHHLFFRPLGRQYWSSGPLMSINETVANIGGKEIGNLVLSKLMLDITMPSSPTRKKVSQIGFQKSQNFNFDHEMRQTRIRFEELLDKGLIQEAEKYLVDRREIFSKNGHYIRKLNQAYFAFHGTYADSPAARSDIEPQLKVIRGASTGLGDFLKKVSFIESTKDLEEMALLAGWKPK